MNVDVVVCTYNSGRFIRYCLESVSKNVPLNNLFVVDNYSTDDTVKIAKEYASEVFLSRGSLAESRRLSFGLVKTPLFVNVDSDVVLCEDWFNQVYRFWASDTGALWGVALNMLQRELHDYQLAMYRFKAPQRYNLMFLGDMICRRDAVENIVFPKSFLCGAVGGEDYFIKEHIERQGFKTCTVPVYVEHYCNPPPLGLKTFWGGASTRLSYRWGLPKILRAIFLSLPQSMFVACVRNNPLVIPFWLRFRFEELVGWLHWDKYYNLRRKPYEQN